MTCLEKEVNSLLVNKGCCFEVGREAALENSASDTVIFHVKGRHEPSRSLKKPTLFHINTLLSYCTKKPHFGTDSIAFITMIKI